MRRFAEILSKQYYIVFFIPFRLKARPLSIHNI